MTLDEIRQFLDGPAIVSLKGDEFAGLTGNGAIKRAVYDSYARVKWEVSNAGIGTVLLTKSGINDSMRHGYGREKLAAFAAVPEVIQSGVVVDHSQDWKGRGYESFVVAAPISIAGIAYCAFVIVNSVKDGGHRFYLHEVGKIEDMKKSGGLRSGSSDCSALSSTPGSVRSLAFSIFSVKGASMGADNIERKC